MSNTRQTNCVTLTNRAKAKLFGRLSDAEQRTVVHLAHKLADRHQKDAAILVGLCPLRGTLARVVLLDQLTARDQRPVRIVRHRPERNADIRGVIQAESRRRSAPWEGRGNHD